MVLPIIICKGVKKVNETRTTQNNIYYSEGISLWRLLDVIKNNLLLIIIMTVVISAVSFGVAKYALIPQYTSSSQILVNQKNATDNGQAFTNQQADIQMINTYKGLITNHQNLNAARKRLANPIDSDSTAYRISYKKLQKMVSVQTTQNSQLFEIRAKSQNAQEAATVANTVTDVFQERVKNIMGFKNTKVTSRAIVQTKPSFPNIKLFTLGGALLGFFLGIVIAVIKEGPVDKRIQ